MSVKVFFCKTETSAVSGAGFGGCGDTHDLREGSGKMARILPRYFFIVQGNPLVAGTASSPSTIVRFSVETAAHGMA
jgi:hypothetical protein